MIDLPNKTAIRIFIELFSVRFKDEINIIKYIYDEFINLNHDIIFFKLNEVPSYLPSTTNGQ